LSTLSPKFHRNAYRCLFYLDNGFQDRHRLYQISGEPMDQNSFLAEVTGQLTELVASGTLNGWSLNATSFRSHQRLYASPNGTTLSCHQNRRVEGCEHKLSVYTPADDPESLGTAAIDLVTFRPIDLQLKEAVELSHGSRNRAWVLAAPPSTPPAPVESCDSELRDRPEAVLESIEQQFNEAFKTTSGCRLNSAELFLNYSISTRINSEGLTFDVEQSNAYLEAAMEKTGQENDKEVHEHTTGVTIADLDVAGFIGNCALQVSVLGDSREPETTDSATILIDEEPLSQMLDTLVQQLNCSNEYLKLPFLQPGDAFGGGEGDGLHLKLDPTIPCMVLSSAYAADGLPAKAGCLIENNEVKNRTIGNRFGQYLGLEPNGISGNLVVQPGSLTKESLSGTEYIEIIKFSSLLIDARKLTWSSEIKLGRHVAADGSTTLVKGGVVSGNLKENFTGCRLSASLGRVNVPVSSYAPPLGYCGPDAMLITQGVSIAGQTKPETKDQ
jgi:predicted Zn-dependent protease